MTDFSVLIGTEMPYLGRLLPSNLFLSLVPLYTPPLFCGTFRDAHEASRSWSVA